MFIRSLLTGTALLSLVAMPAFAAAQAPAAAKPAAAVSSTATTGIANTAKPVPKTEAAKPVVKTASAEKSHVRKSAHKHRGMMHKSSKEKVDATSTSAPSAAKPVK